MFIRTAGVQTDPRLFQGEGGTPPPTPPPPPTSPSPSQREVELRAELREAQVGTVEWKKKFETLEAEVTRVKGEAETKVQEATKPLAERLTRAQGRILDSEIRVAAVAAGLEDMDFLALLDRTGVQVNEELEVSGAKEAIEKLKATKPALFKQPPAAGGATSPPPARQTGGATPPPAGGGTPGLTDVRAMTKEQYAAFRSVELRKLRTA